MKNNDSLIHDADRTGIDPCECPQCNGAAGTTRVCFNARKLAARLRDNPTLKKAAFLLLACFFLPGRANACGTNPVATHPSRVPAGAAFHAHANGIKSPIDPNFYQSSDNPFNAD